MCGCWFVLLWLYLCGTVPRKQWKTSNNCPLLEFIGHQPTLLCSSSRDFFFFLPAKCWCLKYRTPWQWLLLWLREVSLFFWLSYCEWAFINEWIVKKSLALAATKFPFLHSVIGFFFLKTSHRLHSSWPPWTKGFFFLLLQYLSLFIMCIMCFSSIHSPSCTCTHPLLPSPSSYLSTLLIHPSCPPQSHPIGPHLATTW